VPELWNELQRENEYARQKGIHDRGDAENNFRRLYSATGFNTAWTLYQQKMLDTVNQKIAGMPKATEPVDGNHALTLLSRERR
jgi:hypothetical protein